jgi:predicted metalloprotease with PDZ domain
MKKIAISCLAWFTAITFSLADTGKPEKNLYQYSVDLTKVSNDQVTVNLIVPAMKKKEVVFYMPKIVPGTYANYNFGRFISGFTARDKKGKILQVEKIDENSWRIKNAKNLNRVSYTVDDTWDTDIREDFVFEPGGTNIEKDTNFVINTHGFFGYFDDLKRARYEINITKPEGFYGSTSLTTAKSSNSQDVYLVDSYMDLVDAPMMYNRPDTTILHIGGADILVSVYSPNKMASSKEIAANINEVLEAQKEYLGGQLPIKKYAFIIYLFDKPTKSGSMGALEHSYSSLYTLPEAQPELLAQTIRDVSAHEFFHILTPLSIHSEEIHNFDFNKPKMSKHLWLYEGITEYFAGHMQVKHGLIELPQYIGMIQEKMMQAEQFNDTLPFTVMSTNALDIHKDQYGNVYQKGALIGLALDIKLRELSQGKYGLQNLMQDLAKTYGKEKAFKDDELFEQIAKLTYPEIRTFFTRYVEGNKPLPLQEILSKVGIVYEANAVTKGVTLGNMEVNFNPETQRLIVTNTEQLDEFGKAMGFKEGDEFISFNGTKLSIDNIQQVIMNYIMNGKAGDQVSMVVARKDEKGKEKEVKLSAKAIETEKKQKHVLRPVENPGPEQITLRKAWLQP